MSKSTSYFLNVGDADYKRLQVLNQLYNPGTLAFLKKCGLKAGMSVLEIGCGTGHMAVELAKIVGNEVKVLATDLNEAQLDVAKYTAKQAGISNIEFLQFDLNSDISKLQPRFDFIFGRWVIEFTKNPKEVFQSLFNLLKPGGTLAYESTDIYDSGCFGYPDNRLPALYQQLGIKLWQANQMELNFIKQAYFLLKQFNATDLQMSANQVIAQTAEEKLPFRLGLETGKTTIIKHSVLTEQEVDHLINEYKDFEESDNIAGFYRNLLVAGKRENLS